MATDGNGANANAHSIAVAVNLRCHLRTVEMAEIVYEYLHALNSTVQGTAAVSPPPFHQSCAVSRDSS